MKELVNMSNSPKKTTLVTISDLMDIFGVKQITIYRWRKQAHLDDAALVPIPGRNSVILRYDLAKVLAWAKSTEREVPGLKEWKAQHHPTLVFENG
jgi:hypothetical protein